ncbi:hypothetical protein HYH03_003461 [Edaphochlamys debaryana]|uniref:Uncharacterized protein n=1 Tax=Edaphochlamys debaryana TaxID=47281 RepID=A0A835Y9Y3_9CHLO|nr:hypothetical protein HYH03_003461 [Edaphochlamys debaryana]|eukprot:KAG2498721.1 hypothetical protein HYH03_003461 [Edaphochlamys debaryana]
MLLARLPPVPRAALTSCVVMSTGDVVCQAIQRRGKPGAWSDMRQHDWSRTARFGLIGLTLHGPYFLWGFRMIDNKFGPATNLLTAAKKTAFGQVTLFPVYVAVFYTYVTLLETWSGDLGRSAQAVQDKLRQVFVPTYMTGSVFWPIANIFNFTMVPPTNRVLYVNCAGLIWNAILSAYNSRALEAQQQEQRPAVAAAPAAPAEASGKKTKRA